MDIHSINLAALIASIASFGFSTMARKSSIYLNLGWVAFALTGSLYVCSGWKAWGGSGWIDESDPELRFSSLFIWTISFAVLWISEGGRARTEQSDRPS
ncbi:hypothetical protein L0Z42_29515 [Burkholderia multivorans]|uniref:hypothetical protein n=1 Tax=Burkholderia cepacia complex TaxID=87882 RepID=UPI0011B1E50E|nr:MULTISPECIES: hypothetical protein [Burkholderia cepacia complex]MBJ9624990.1 hypothetical protein [Burkholderia multivorans]MCO1374630.1 hypothetical protein [Burkholderia multivorans]MCO1459773.1 hypothetical protein [Burkholderia multivorans]UQO21221.1 hypothetical protein L0Z02_28780 [Burkholderia multivorans]UQO87447.1 hypothetical protein L0Y86_29495 [Burkholderia multivorans]